MKTLKTTTDTERLARRLWAVGDPVRLRILRLLPTEPTDEKGCNVSTIAEKIRLSQPCVSHHLRILRQADMIAHEKRCRDTIYWVRSEEVGAVAETLREVLRRDD